MIESCLAPFRSCLSSASTAPEPSSGDERSSVHSESSADEVINIQGDQFDDKQKEEAAGLNLTSFDMMALGLTGAIGGHYFAWNAGLTIGFGGFLIALFFISTGYFCLILCISELSSALPFAGGAYGIARVTLGVYPGFLVAVCDTYKSIIYAASAAYAVGDIITFATGYDRKYEHGWWIAYYAVLMCIHCYGGRFFWRVNTVLAIISTLILFVYIFGTIKFADFQANAHLQIESDRDNSKWFYGGMYQFVHVFPRASRFFVGIQSINLACGQLKNPKTDVPRGSVGAMTFCMFTSFAVLFLGASLPPGLNAFIERARPLTKGFQLMFGLPRDRATLLNLPATFMSGSAFIYYYGQQISAMGKSGMLSALFGVEIEGRNTPVVGLAVGSLIGFALCEIEFYYPDAKETIYDISILAATATYLSIFASYIMFCIHFPSIQREFQSPVGIAGAVYGFAVFSLSFISMCGFQKNQMAIVVFVIILAVASIYYYFVVQTRQVFSEEEKTVMFKAYLVMNNAAKAKRVKRGMRRAANAARQSAPATPISGGPENGHGHGHDSNARRDSSENRSNTFRMPYMFSDGGKVDQGRNPSPAHINNPAPSRAAPAGGHADIEAGTETAALSMNGVLVAGEEGAGGVVVAEVRADSADVESGRHTPPLAYDMMRPS